MTLDDLFETVKQRRAASDPEESWTAKLMAKGPEKCAEKFGEEAVEAIIEAVKNDPIGPDQRSGRCDISPDGHAARPRR